MKKINLKGISEILSEKDLKNVMGGSGNSIIIGGHKLYDCTCPNGKNILVNKEENCDYLCEASGNV